MKFVKGLVLAVVASVGVAGAAAAAEPVTAKYYAPGDYSENYGVGITFSGTPYQTDYISGINNYDDTGSGEAVFNTDPNFPSATYYFGADFTSQITVSATSGYTFTLTTDDAGYLFVDGTLAVSLPGDHYPATGNSGIIDLSAGTHAIEVEMDNAGGPCCTQASLVLPQGVTYSAASSGGVPEPATWAMMISGFGLSGVLLRRRRLTVQAI